MRWLNVTKNGEVLTNKLIEIMDATPNSVQVEIVSSFPEIIPDHLHDLVVGELKKEAWLGKKHLTATILDTFSNLSLKSDMSMLLRSHVLDKIKDAPKEELPIMVKFVVSCTTAREAVLEIDTLRDNLDLDKGFEILSQRMKKKTSKDSEEFDVLVLEVIRLAINSEVLISDAWFNAIDKGTLLPEQKLKSLDLLVLFQLYDLPNKRKNVESLFKNKIRSGKLTEELVRKCFKVCTYK